MVGLKRGLVGAALGIGLMAAPGSAWAVASFSVTFGIDAGFLPGSISGTGSITSTFTDGGQTIVSEIELADSSFAATDFDPEEFEDGPIVTPIANNPTAPILMPGVKISYNGFAQDGGSIDSFGSATLTMLVANTGATALTGTLRVFPNLTGSAVGTEPGDYAQVEAGFVQLDDEGDWIGSTVRFLAKNTDGVDDLFSTFVDIPFTVGVGSSANIELWFGAFGAARSTADEEVVPVPAALPLLATALVGLGVAARRRRKAA